MQRSQPSQHSKHYLVDSVTEDKTFSAYTLDKENQVVWQDEVKFSNSFFVIQCSEHPHTTEMTASTLKRAGEELKRKTKWEGGDFFITAMKCGREHSIKEENILGESITLVGCKQISSMVKVHEGDHLEFRDLKNIPRSVLVTKCLDHTQVTVKPPTDDGEVLDLTTYPEVYRVEYSQSLPNEETVIRGNSRLGIEMAQKYSLNNPSLFVSWAKTGRELPLPSDIIESRFTSESVQSNEIEVADHIVECVDGNRKHYLVTQKCKASSFTVIFCQAGGVIRNEIITFNSEQLYRIKYLNERYLDPDKAIERASSQIGQWKHSPWDRMLFIMEAKTGRDSNPTAVVSHCKKVSEKEKLNEGHHLICKKTPNTIHSLIVVEYIDPTKVLVTPHIDGRKEVDLTRDYSEIYRIEYSDCSTLEYAAYSAEISLSLEDFINAKFALESVTSASQIQIGDHLVEHNKSGQKHFVVSGHKKRSIYSVVYSQAGRIYDGTSIDISCTQMYRIVHLQRPESIHEVIKRAKLHIGQQQNIPWDQLLVNLHDKDFKKPTSKSQITSFSQLELGDYVVAEPRMGHSRHYIIAFIGLPDLCIAIESHQGNVSKVSLSLPDAGKYPKYYRMNYEPGVCIAAKVTADLALSLVDKKFNRRNFIHFLKTNNEHTDDIESSVKVGSCDRSEITDFSEVHFGDYLVKEPIVGASHHYLIASVSSSGIYTAVECFQGRLSKVILTNPHLERHSKYYRMNYPSSTTVRPEESVRKALLLVDKNFVHFLKTNEEDCELDDKSVELVTTGAIHNMASPQHIKPISGVNDIKVGDHIVYSTTKPPLRPVYCSGLVTNTVVNTEGSGEVDLVTFDKRGCVEKTLDLEVTVNLGKVVYQGCCHFGGDASIRAKQALQLKDKKGYDEGCNNSHHFVTRLKTDKENSLSELLRIFIKSTKKGKVHNKNKNICIA